MNKIYIFSIFASVLLQVSCSRDFDPGVDVQPIAVLNVLVENDSRVSASVTRTWKFGGSVPDVIQSDADVHLVVNGDDKGLMEFDADEGKYKSSYIARQGDRITVSAHTRNYGDAEGTTMVPEIVPIDSFSCNAMRVLDQDSYYVDVNGVVSRRDILQFHYKITFTDPGDEENYYMISSSFQGQNEPLFKEHNTPLDEVFSYADEFNVFTDRSINGTTYTLNIYTNLYGVYGNYSEYLVDTIKLYSISREYYLYLLSIYRKYCGLNSELESIGLAHPKNVFSNVAPGVGIVASSSFDMVEYNKFEDVKRLFPEWLPKD